MGNFKKQCDASFADAFDVLEKELENCRLSLVAAESTLIQARGLADQEVGAQHVLSLAIERVRQLSSEVVKVVDDAARLKDGQIPVVDIETPPPADLVSGVQSPLESEAPDEGPDGVEASAGG